MRKFMIVSIRGICTGVISLAFCLSLAAFANPSSAQSTSPTAEPTTEPTSAPTTSEATGKAALKPCKFDVGYGAAKSQVDAQCTTIQVPEDWAKPDGRKIDLAVVVLAATGTGPKAEPVFHLEGGPGASAIENFGLSFFSAYRDVRQNHDVVLIDQRGTGKSSSLQCTEITDEALNDLAKPDDNEQDSIQTEATRLKTCLMRLSKTSDPAFYTSTILADDTDFVRQTLGYDKIDLYGSSYGTWLGQIYLARHGEHVNALVLDSVAGPWNFVLLEAKANSQAALDKVFALCKADKNCNAVYPNLSDKMKTALAALEKKPEELTTISPLSGKTFNIVLTRSRFLETIRTMLYQSANIGILPQAISQAADGNFALIAPNAVLEAETAPFISIGLYYSVHCSESLPFYTKDALTKNDPNAFYGIDETSNDDLSAACKVWRSAELNNKDVAPVKSNRPVLIFSGSFDPITSPAFAEETHQRLSNSNLVTFPYQAHAPFVSSKCAQNLVTAFFNAPDKPLDTACAALDIKPTFLGAYKVDLVPYSDPGGKFTVNIPKGWAVDPGKASDDIAFFASPDKNELLGVAFLKDSVGEDAQKLAVQAITKAYGPVDIQTMQEQSLFVSSILLVQHALTTPEQSYVGILMLVSQGGNTRVIWYAAPANIVQAGSLSIAAPVLISFVPAS